MNNEILKEINVFNRNLEINQKARIIKVTIDKIENIYNLHNFIIDNLENKEFFIPYTKEEVKHICKEENGIIIGVFIEDKVIAMSAIEFDSNNEVMFAKDINFINDNENVIEIGGCMVAPEYRGNNLMQIMNELLLEKVIENENIRYIGATAHPQNYYSVSSLLKLGMIIANIKYKHGNFLRNIMFKDIRKEIKIDRNNNYVINALDVDKQIELINLGYVGYEIIKYKNNEVKVIFGKIIV